MKLRLLSLACAMLLSIRAEAGTLNPKPISGDGPVAPQSLEALIGIASQARSGLSGIRLQVLRETGQTLGFRGGLQQRGKEYAAGLEGRAEVLDQIFEFATLVSVDGVLPPVIEEASDVASFEDEQFRTAEHVYRIARAERFVSVPPTWRDYLVAGLLNNSPIDLPDYDIRPKTDEEAKVWRQAVIDGWNEGQRQGEVILVANFNRLTRDYTGMLRYSTLIQLGQIRRTRVAESVATVSGNGQRLAIGDRHRRIIDKAMLESNPNKWTPTGLVEKPETRAAGASALRPAPAMQR